MSAETNDEPVVEQLNFKYGGKITIDVFDQDKIWKDASGYTWKLEEMDPSHRSNLMAFLERGALRFRIRWEFAKLWGVPIPVYGDFDDTGIFDDDAFMTPEEWLHATPLFQRLEELQYPPGPVDFSK